MNAGWNKSAFFWYHDSHWQNNSGRSPEILKYLQYKTPINKTNYGGDITDLEQEDLSKLDYLWSWRQLLNGVNNHHSVAGNHDDCNSSKGNGQWWSLSDVYAYLLGPEAQPHVNQGEGLYYYIDDNSEHTRYIYLDTATSKGTISKTDINNQLIWLKQTLLSTPSKWHIVAIAHIWKDYASVTIDGTKYYYLNKAWEGNNNDYYGALALKELGRYNAREGNYSTCDAKVEFCIGGHTHWDGDYIYTYENVKIPVIITTCDALGSRLPLKDTTSEMEDYSATVWDGDLPKDQITIGSTNESAVDAIIADYSNGYVNIIRFGRGTSRKVYLDCRENIHELIEDTNVPNMPEGTYNNILIQVGYLDDARVSTSNSGLTQNAAGWDTTGYINCNQGDIISFANVEFYDQIVTSKRSGIHYYDANKMYLGSDVATPLPSRYKAINDETTGDLLQFVLPGLNAGKYSYIRITASDFNDGSVITVNQPLYNGHEIPGGSEPDNDDDNENIPDVAYPDDVAENFNTAPAADATNMLRSAGASLNDFEYSSNTDTWTLKTDASIPNNGWGYLENSRINSSGNIQAEKGWDLTGLMLAKYGTMFKLENILFRDTYYANAANRASIEIYSDTRDISGGSASEINSYGANFGDRSGYVKTSYTPIYNNEHDIVQFTLPRNFGQRQQFIRITADDITQQSKIRSEALDVNIKNKADTTNLIRQAEYPQYPITYNSNGEKDVLLAKDTYSSGLGYNCGRGFVNNAICKIKSETEYWDLYTEGWSITGLIPINGISFKLENINIGSGENAKILFFADDTKYISEVAASSLINDTTLNLTAKPNNATYFRLVAQDINMNSKITVIS